MMRTKVVLPCACLAAFLLLGCWGGNGSSPEVTFTEIGAGLTGLKDCSVAWGDYDGDGDLDLALAGLDDAGTYVSKICENAGDGTFADIGASLLERSHSLAWGDYDGDGDLDLVMAGYYHDGTKWVPDTKLYRNDAGALTELDVGLSGSRGFVTWIDFDNDGDLDIAFAGVYDWVAEANTSKIARNDGNDTFVQVAAGFADAGRVDLDSLAAADFDGDGDLDLALAGEEHWADPSGGWTRIYSNQGGTFSDIGLSLQGVMNGSLAWGDYDSDGDPDLALAGFAGEAVPSTTRLYWNDGAGAFSEETAAALEGVNSCAIAWGDCDNDGDPDLAVAGAPWFGGSLGRVYRNEGNGAFTDASVGLTGMSRSALAWGDYDDDGDLDLVVAGRDEAGSAKTIVYQSSGAPANTPPTSPTGLSATPGSGTATFAWNAATDAETPPLGLTYNLRVGTASEKDDVMPGHALIGGPDDGKRLIPAMGNVQHNTSWTLSGLALGDYYWSVQAVDTAFEGSPWAPEETVTLP